MRAALRQIRQPYVLPDADLHQHNSLLIAFHPSGGRRTSAAVQSASIEALRRESNRSPHSCVAQYLFNVS